MALGDDHDPAYSGENEPGCDSDAVGDEQLNQCLRYCADDDLNADDSFIVTSGSSMRGSSCSEVTIEINRFNRKESVVEFCKSAQLTSTVHYDDDGEPESMPANDACCICGGGTRDTPVATAVVFGVALSGCVIFSCCYLMKSDIRDVECRTGVRIFGFTMFAMVDWITDFGFVYGSLEDSAFAQTCDADSLDDIKIAAKTALKD